MGIARPGFYDTWIIQFSGRRTPGFRRPWSASAERSGDRSGKKRPYVEEQFPQNWIPRTKPHIFNFPGDAKSFTQPAISLKLSAHNREAQ